jgi:hypothetical protein
MRCSNGDVLWRPAMTGGKRDIVAPYPICQAEPARHKDFCFQSYYQTAKARQRQEDGRSRLAQQNGAQGADSQAVVGDESRCPVCCATRHDRNSRHFASKRGQESKRLPQKYCAHETFSGRTQPAPLRRRESGIPGSPNTARTSRSFFMRCVQLFGIAGIPGLACAGG